MPEMFKRALIPEVGLSTNIKSASEQQKTILRSLRRKIAAIKLQIFFRKILAKRRRPAKQN